MSEGLCSSWHVGHARNPHAIVQHRDPLEAFSKCPVGGEGGFLCSRGEELGAEVVPWPLQRGRGLHHCFFTPGVILLKYLETSSGHCLLFLMGSRTTRAEKPQFQLNNGAFIDICSQGASTQLELQLGLLVYQPPSSGSRQSCLLFGVRAACRGQLRKGSNVPVSPPTHG